MFYKTVEEFSDVISGYTVTEFRKYGQAVSLTAKIKFIDGAVLIIKDYLFLDGQRKYSFHWQDSKGNLISRWDNSPHHKTIISFPHHRHTPEKVYPSNERNLKEILKAIKKTIKDKETTDFL